MKNESRSEGFDFIDPLSGFDEFDLGTPNESDAKDSDAVMSVQESICALLDEVQGLRPVFEGIVNFCRTERRPAEVDEKYAQLTEFNVCTFSPIRVRAMLEEVGALVYIEPDQSDDAQENLLEAEAVFVDGECYEIATRPEGRWLATQAGLEVVDARSPMAEVSEMLRLEPEFAPEFKKIIEALVEGPKSITELEQLVEQDELMLASHRYASFLVKRLESCGVIGFCGKWTLLEPGCRVLSGDSLFMLESVEGMQNDGE